MYTTNGKISGRQLFRLYVFDLIGISTLLIPPLLVKFSGIDGIFAILVGGILSLGYLWYLGLVLRKMNTDLAAYLETRCPKWVRNIIYLCLFLHGTIASGFVAYIFANLMQDSLVRDVEYWLLLWVTIVVAAYSVRGGVENRARIYEVLFWVILIPFVIMMLLSLKNVEPVYLNHFFESKPIDLLKGSGLVFVFLTPLFFVLFLISRNSDARTTISDGKTIVDERQYELIGKQGYCISPLKIVAKAVLLATVILLGSYVILCGNFGGKALKSMDFPVITLMNDVQIKGNFLKRMDALMLGVWFFTLLALLNLHMHFGVMGINKVVQSKRKWGIFLVSMGVFGVAWLLKIISSGVDFFVKYYLYIAIPIMVIGPGVVLLREMTTGTQKKTDQKGKRTKIKTIHGTRMFVVCLLIASLSYSLTGCQATQLENRCFPMMVAVDYDEEESRVLFYESFPEAKENEKDGESINETSSPVAVGKDFGESKANFEKTLSKIPDYNHLKVIVLGESLMKHPEVYQDMIHMLAEGERFPRNTYVCVTEIITGLIELQDALPQELGTFLEEYLENHKGEHRHLLSLGDIIDEERNQELILYAPYLSLEEEYIEWIRNYEITQKFMK